MSWSNFRRVGRVRAVLLAALLLLTACSGADDAGSGDAATPGASVSPSASASPSASVSQSAEQNESTEAAAGEAVERITAAAERTFAGSSRVEATQVIANQPVSTSTGTYDYARQVGQVTTSVAGQELEVVITPDTAYVGLNEQGATGYVPFPLDGSSAFGSFIAQSQSPEAQRESLTVFAQATDVTEAGRETVRAGEATKYTGNLAIEDVAAAAGAAAEALRQALPAGALVPFSIWVDDEDRVVKTELVIDVPQAGEATTTVEYYDFGVQVEAAAPPADQLLPEAQAAEIRSLFDQQIAQLQPPTS